MNYLLLLETASKIRSIQNKFYKKISDETGMHYTALEIIIFLFDNPYKNTAKEICDLLNLKSNLVSFHVKKLVDGGFLIRESIDSDRRKVKLLITDKGVSVAKHCNEIRSRLYLILTKKFVSDELNLFYDFISKLNKTVEDIDI